MSYFCSDNCDNNVKVSVGMSALHGRLDWAEFNGKSTTVLAANEKISVRIRDRDRTQVRVRVRIRGRSFPF